MDTVTEEAIKKHGFREHRHMLRCGVGYFETSFPEEYADLKGLPFEVAFAAMKAKYDTEVGEAY
jgi:hypothetical protein